MQQTIRYTRTADGVNLAWATAGEGPTLVKASNWLTHLEFDWDSPVWRHWIRFLAGNYRFIRYDERGCGMSDWTADDLHLDHWFGDLDAVIDAADPEPPIILLGISQGGAAAIDYATRHPEKVSHLILYGAYARGAARRGDPDVEKRFHAIMDLTKVGWGRDNPVYRQVFTARFIPDGTPEQMQWFNELCRKTSTPEVASKLLEVRSQIDVSEKLAAVSVPTLVIHAREDEVVGLSEGKFLASEIPGATFVQLDSRNHILLEHEPAWERFKAAVLEFTGIEAPAGTEDPIFEVLTDREREILTGMANGLSNQEIGNQLFISEKTVRNNVTKIYEKLGVHSRAQAIVLAKDKHLGASGGGV